MKLPGGDRRAYRRVAGHAVVESERRPLLADDREITARAPDLLPNRFGTEQSAVEELRPVERGERDRVLEIDWLIRPRIAAATGVTLCALSRGTRDTSSPRIVVLPGGAPVAIVAAFTIVIVGKTE